MKSELRIFPRITNLDSHQIWESIREHSINELIEISNLEHEYSYYPATGGTRISADELQNLQVSIRELATSLGYPELPKRKQAAEFDFKGAITLFKQMAIAPGEAAHNDVWSFIGLVLLPDVIRWRFSTSGEERFIGNSNQRNALQRLWWRAYVLRDHSSTNEFQLLNHLPEDALVGIMERPGVSSNISLAFQIAYHSALLDEKIDRKYLETARREAIKKVRCYIPVLSVDSLANPQLESFVGNIYDQIVDRYS